MSINTLLNGMPNSDDYVYWNGLVQHVVRPVMDKLTGMEKNADKTEVAIDAIHEDYETRLIDLEVSQQLSF